LQGLDVVLVERTTHTKLALPPAEGADFHLNIYVYDDGEPQITAQPLGHGSPRDARDQVAFWGLSFEVADYRTDEERNTAFLATLDLLLTHEVRITQRRGCLNYHFTCEYKNGDDWLALPGILHFRWSHSRFLRCRARHLRFLSPALLGSD
jgi:hypothetical protein